MKFAFDPQALWSKYFSSVNSVIRAGLGIGIVSLFALSYVRGDELTFFQRLELLAYDARLRATMPEKIDSRIVIIDIDEKSLTAEGRWPWGRDKLAVLIDQLFERYKVKVVGFDILFSEADNSSGLKNLEALAAGPFKNNPDFQSQLAQMRPQLDYDARFTEQIKKHAVVLSFSSSNERADLSQLGIGTLPNASFRVTDSKGRPIRALEIPGYSAPLPRFQEVASATGHILPQIDFDGVLRRVPAFVKFKDGYYEALSISMYRTFLDNEPLVLKLREDEGDDTTKINTIALRNSLVHLDDDTSMLVPYRGRSPMFRYISATDVIRGALQPGELDGKIALVGTSAQGLFDLRNTPVGEVYPGVETHANLVSGMLDNSIKRKPHFENAIRVLTVLLIGLPLAFALVKMGPAWSTATVLLSSAALIAFNLYWWFANVVLPIAMPLMMIGTLYLLNMAYGFFVEDRSKRQITGIFGTYVPKELVEEMAKNPSNYSTQGESRDMTVLFSDVRNFTSISEGLSATELTAMMNNYLTEMTQTIQTDRGTIDKYIGDAIMAFWGAPLKDEKHAEHALTSALAMQKRIAEMGPEYLKRGWPKLEIGVGLNCGVMNVGDMGSSFRRAYTVMGDAVNLASRLEGLTKEYGVGILVSENIVKAVPNVVYRELDRVRVKGKLEPIGIYEPAGKVGEVGNAMLDDIDRFHRALEHYRAQRWDEAENALVALARGDPQRMMYQKFLERVNDLRMKPPGKNWDGVFTFSTK
jgi:adenylate cyclase